MAANPKTDFDLGPLTWVKTEIDHSLNQARENLDKLAAAADDRAPVKYILTHLHQATGALAMVGLGAATRFNEELEKLVPTSRARTHRDCRATSPPPRRRSRRCRPTSTRCSRAIPTTRCASSGRTWN